VAAALMRAAPTGPAAVVAAARVGWGALLLADPRRVLALTQPGRAAPVAATRVLRVLGARHLVQTAVQLAGPAPLVHHLGAAADALHALTGAGLAAVDRRWRRAALIDCLVATGFALGTALTAHGEGPRCNRATPPDGP
jgi:hypothetical protein